jgi:gliding motility-associated-like protein
VPTYIWYPPSGPGVPGTQFNTTAAGGHTAISTSAVNGCTAEAFYNVGTDLTPPAINAATEFILDCNNTPTVALTPSITGATTGFTYSWTVPPGALTSNLTSSLLVTNKEGNYFITVTNTINGCVNQGDYSVVGGQIIASFEPNPAKGYAPLDVTFTNNSSTSTGASSIISTWGYGDGAVTNTIVNSTIAGHTYNSAGTYSVYLKVQKGSCVDTTLRIVIVELPSKMEIPNVFTPNGDGTNDIFRLRASNLKVVYIIIYDRWGNKVYETTSESGNFAWDGNNLQGKKCADGTYFYIIKATGSDGEEYDEKGNVSLYR